VSSSLESPDVAVDLVVLTIRREDLCFLAINRGIDPFKGELALPGGFVLADESLDEAAARELEEETGISGLSRHSEQLETFGDPRRDPRRRIFSVAYLALVPHPPEPVGGSDARSAQWMEVGELPTRGRRLAFDHDEILHKGVERARAKLEYTPLASSFCPEVFTIAELRKVYEVVWGVGVDPRNFHRKVTSTEGFVEPTGERTVRDGGRPAQLYRAGTETTALYPPLVRRRVR
jgi:8-oxo-dGTP diphosphatase